MSPHIHVPVLPNVLFLLLDVAIANDGLGCEALHVLTRALVDGIAESSLWHLHSLLLDGNQLIQTRDLVHCENVYLGHP